MRELLQPGADGPDSVRMAARRPDETAHSFHPIAARGVPAGPAGLALQAAEVRRAVGQPGNGVAFARHIQRRYGNRYVQLAASVARRSVAYSGGEVAPEVEQAIQQARGGGWPLDRQVQASMEDAFGADFGQVRVHTGPQADALNQSLSARAFTTGHDIFFGEGQYNPQSSAGQELLAHELTHVVQQRGAVQAKLAVGPADDAYEREADAVARAVVAHTSRTAPTGAGTMGVQRQLEEEQDEEPERPGGSAGAGVAQRQSDDEQDDEPESLGGSAATVQRQVDEEQDEEPESFDGGGGAAAVQRLCAACAEEQKESAETTRPEPASLFGGAPALHLRGARIQRELAVEPPNPNAVAPALTEPQMRDALRYNEMRFKDPYSVAVIRDVIGIPRFPAVADEAFAQAIAQWQAEHNLTPDGQCGPATTRTLVTEVRAEGNTQDAAQLRADNYVSWNDVNGPTYRRCSNAVHGFQWDVTFSTSLRRGWIIQELTNTWNVTNCNGTPYTGWNATPHYYEAWWVNGSGQVMLPTSLATPPAAAATAGIHDMWRRPMLPGTRGTWSMSARLFTTLTLPPGFAIRGVPDAVDLPARVGTVNSDLLGLEAGRRSVGGEWNCCDPDPARHFHRSR